MVTLTFPDGAARSYPDGTSGAEIAAAISKSLAKKAVAVTLDGVLADLSEPITADARLEIVTRDDARALELIRHDFAHVMARAVQELWPDVKVTIGPVRDYGWFYDFDREEPFTPDDLGAIEAGAVGQGQIERGSRAVALAPRRRVVGEPCRHGVGVGGVFDVISRQRAVAGRQRCAPHVRQLLGMQLDGDAELATDPQVDDVEPEDPAQNGCHQWVDAAEAGERIGLSGTAFQYGGSRASCSPLWRASTS